MNERKIRRAGGCRIQRRQSADRANFKRGTVGMPTTVAKTSRQRVAPMAEISNVPLGVAGQTADKDRGRDFRWNRTACQLKSLVFHAQTADEVGRHVSNPPCQVIDNQLPAFKTVISESNNRRCCHTPGRREY